MHITRREFALALASGLAALLVPQATALGRSPLFADHIDGATKDTQHRKAHVESGVHHHKSHGETSPIVHTWTPIDLTPGVTGGMGIEIDKDGKYSFTGHFFDGSGESDRVALVLGIKSDGADGSLYLFEANGVMSGANGGTSFEWNKTGHSDKLRNAWNDLYKAHDWNAHAYVAGPQAPGGLGDLTYNPSTAPPAQIDEDALINRVETRLKAVGPVTTIVK